MTTTSSTSASLALSGLASGIDWTSIVSELLTVEGAPEVQMNAQISAAQTKSAAYSAIGTQLTTLGKDVTTLSDPTFFDSRKTSLTNSIVASATAATATPLGSYAFNVTKLASSALQQGTSSIGAPLSASNNVSSLQVGTAGFALPVTAGTFTVNGQIVNISSTDTLQSVFDHISAATGGAVSGSYDSTTDEISLTSTTNPATPIVLGSAKDTSNFLLASELYNNGTGIITSVSGLGGVNLNNSMTSANLSTTISDGGSGAGSFMINGAQISFNASTDSLNDVLQRINDSEAGVTATYDSVNDRFQLTNKTTGDVGISMQDMPGGGNFLAATGLTGGTLQHGSNLQYSINGGGTLTSESNTIDATSAGVAGLSITALGLGATTISISSDTTSISSAISSFVTDYNAIQTYISGQIKPSTDSSGNVTPGTLTGDFDAEGIAGQLRQFVGAAPSGLSGALQTLNGLGILSNGTDNTLSLSDPTTLNSALANNLDAVKKLFTSGTGGIATSLQTYLANVNGVNGTLADDENNMTSTITGINTSITTLKARISQDQDRLTNEFVAMETAINTINSQKQYLNAFFNGNTTASSQTAPTAAGSSSSASSSTSSTG